MAQFSQHEIEAIAAALGDTIDGLSGSEIAHMLRVCKIPDTDPSITKRYRLLNAFANIQNEKGNRTNILEFVRQSLAPSRFLQNHEKFEPLRSNVNRALAFSAMYVDEAGKLKKSTSKATTLTEARKRASELRSDLASRGVHPDVLKFCREELLADNYFHAVLEAVKSVGDKLRRSTGLTDDGATLVDRALGGERPMIAINGLASKSELDEQKGFVNLLKGTFGMFRNPTAHEARVNWQMRKEDAEDLLSLVSLIHRRLDAATMPSRI